MYVLLITMYQHLCSVIRIFNVKINPFYQFFYTGLILTFRLSLGRKEI